MPINNKKQRLLALLPVLPLLFVLTSCGTQGTANQSGGADTATKSVMLTSADKIACDTAYATLADYSRAADSNAPISEWPKVMLRTADSFDSVAKIAELSELKALFGQEAVYIRQAEAAAVANDLSGGTTIDAQIKVTEDSWGTICKTKSH